MALDPSLQIIAPWKDPKWDLHSRNCLVYADKHNIPVTQSKKRIYSEDRNIWHISHEVGYWKTRPTKRLMMYLRYPKPSKMQASNLNM